MGGECKKMEDHPLAAQFSLVEAENHPVFGSIVHLRADNTRAEKAVKRVYGLRSSQGMDVEMLKERVQIIKQCDSVSTLVKIYDYELIEGDSQDTPMWTALRGKISCQRTEYPYMLLHFQYFDSECCLASILQFRCATLAKIQKKLGNQAIGRIQSVKMCDYFQIDSLQSQQRQIVNCFYQEIEVVRMIDHLMGALYFLRHFGIEHGGIRPQSVLVDSEGKYLLTDRQAFDQQTNYDIALSCLKASSKKGKGGFQFIAPEWLMDLKQGVVCSIESKEKSDVFCVGLLALRMCLVDADQQIFQYDFTSQWISLNDQVLSKHLLQVRKKYSLELFHLLVDMLKMDPEKRVDFTELIDRLNPILLQNLEDIKQVYNPPVKSLLASVKSLHSSERKEKELAVVGGAKSVLKQNLIKMQEQFQRLMSNRNMLLHKSVNQKVLREEEEKILTKLRQIKMVKSTFDSTTARKVNPEGVVPAVGVFELTGNKQSESKIQSIKNRMISNQRDRQQKRYLKGKELQAIVWQEYENIKSKANPE